MIEEEIWKVTHVCDAYEVSNFGRVRRCLPGPSTYPGKILKPGYDRKGRLYAHLGNEKKRGSYQISRLVAKAFIHPGNIDQVQVAHNDGDITNNRYDNLRWATNKENCADKRIHGTQPMGESSTSSKYTEATIRYIRSSDKSDSELGRELGIGYRYVWEIRQGKKWKHVA